MQFLARFSAPRLACRAFATPPLLRCTFPLLDSGSDVPGIPLDVPRGKQMSIEKEGGWFDSARKVWMAANDNNALVRKYGAHLRVYLDPMEGEGGEMKDLGAHWSPTHMRWYTTPHDEHHKTLVERFHRERIPVDVPQENTKDALAAGLQWCPEGREFFVLANDPKREELMSKFNGKRIYFRVPPEEREAARELGCRYDAVNCGWYTVSGSDKIHLVRDKFDETPRPAVKRETKSWPIRA